MKSTLSHRVGASLVASLFVLSLFSIVPSVAANPAVPFCEAASGTGGSSETSDNYDPALCEQATGRVFPEAIADDSYVEEDAAGHTNTGYASDYLGYFEFQKSIEYLESQYPDRIEVHTVAQSYGLCPVAGNSANSAPLVGESAEPVPDCPVDRDTFDIYMIEVTNENSPMPLDDRQALLFMLSIHGVEKGGREGGVRVIEDLLKGISFAANPVQNGAGMPTPLAKPTGGNVETYEDMLDFTRLFFLFPNSDGWAHDEVPYATSDPSCGAPPNGVSFCRTNGNGVDLNRQGPTLGWQNPTRNVVGEPESIGYYNWMLDQGIEWSYAIDIHGMLNHQNFGAIMLPAASMTPQEMERSVGLAETLKQRLNNDPHFDEWQAVLGGGEDASGSGDEQCEEADCPQDGSGFWDTAAAGSGQFAEYYTVIDAIGYTDSGFNGDFFAQDNGLNAPGYDIELAYNHITSDSQYSHSALWNDYHVHIVRNIVQSYMDAAALDITVSLETNGLKTLVLENPTVVTNLDDVDADGNPAPEVPSTTWAAQNEGDDLWQYTEASPFAARPQKYWEDMIPFVVDGPVPGVLNFQSGSAFTRSTLDAYDNFVIAGSAFSVLENDPAKANLTLEWVKAGGTLVLTDESLQFLTMAGLLAEGNVDVEPRYMGGIKVAKYLDHELLANVRGGVMQMYEPSPLGYGTSETSPNWFIDPAAWDSIGGEVAGLECGLPRLNTPDCDENGIGLGQVDVGRGKIRVMGSLLPDPSEEFYHPYGVDHYATTYSGNAIMMNLLGWEKVYAAPTVTITDGKIISTPNEPVAPAQDDEQDTPTVGAFFAVLVVAFAAIVLRRRE
jgi:hypothetical protein